MDVFVSASISYGSPFSEIIFLPYTHLESVTLFYRCHHLFDVPYEKMGNKNALNRRQNVEAFLS